METFKWFCRGTVWPFIALFKIYRKDPSLKGDEFEMGLLAVSSVVLLLVSLGIFWLLFSNNHKLYALVPLFAGLISNFCFGGIVNSLVNFETSNTPWQRRRLW